MNTSYKYMPNDQSETYETGSQNNLTIGSDTRHYRSEVYLVYLGYNRNRFGFNASVVCRNAVCDASIIESVIYTTNALFKLGLTCLISLNSYSRLYSLLHTVQSIRL